MMTEHQAWEQYSRELTEAAQLRGGNEVRARARAEAEDRFRVNRLLVCREMTR